MNGTTIAGIVLLVLGVFALAYGGIEYTTRDTVVDVGPLEMTAEDTESIPLPPLLGAAMALAGGLLLWKGGRS